MLIYACLLEQQKKLFKNIDLWEHSSAPLWKHFFFGEPCILNILTHHRAYCGYCVVF